VGLENKPQINMDNLSILNYINLMEELSDWNQRVFLETCSARLALKEFKENCLNIAIDISLTWNLHYDMT